MEHLEERTLLSAGAGSGLIGGSVANLALNSNFNQASNGVILPTNTNTNSSGLANGIHSSDLTGQVSSGTNGQAATSSFLAQDQLYSQFRVFGVNSQGANFQQAQLTTDTILRDAYGFGSGTQPNAPWMPNAYNLGLANHQFGYSSQTDLGFSSATRPTAQVTRSQLRDNGQIRPLNLGEDQNEQPEQKAEERSTNDPERERHNRLVEDVRDQNKEWNTFLDQLASEKQDSRQEMSRTEKVSDRQEAVPQDAGIPDMVWLSALAPIPMTALAVGLPEMVGAENGGEACYAPE